MYLPLRLKQVRFIDNIYYILSIKKEMITIVSWNVLAHDYLTSEYQMYTEYARWEVCVQKLLLQLLRCNADIVCLQEVDSRTYTYLKNTPSRQLLL